MASAGHVGMIVGTSVGAHPVPVPQSTISSQASALFDRLDRAVDTTRSLGDRLLGPRPREAGINQKVSGDNALPSIDRVLDLMHSRMNEIEEELTRLSCGV